jgi:hypothetical protein
MSQAHSGERCMASAVRRGPKCLDLAGFLDRVPCAILSFDRAVEGGFSQDGDQLKPSDTIQSEDCRLSESRPQHQSPPL